jgi:hypothetical protein
MLRALSFSLALGPKNLRTGPAWTCRSQSTSFRNIGLTSFVAVVVVLLIFFLSFGNNFIVLTISCYVVGVEFKCN